MKPKPRKPRYSGYFVVLATYLPLICQAGSIEDGNAFFHRERIHSDGRKVSCATCHTADPRNSGLTRANKVIEPMAPSKNPERFTDQAKVEKWFTRNCRDVLERPCTATEKNDFIQYMRSLR